MMDYETGEPICADRETGELPAVPIVNVETGEKECNYTCPRESSESRRTFKIPRIYSPKVGEEEDISIVTFPSDKISPALMFLLPTAFLFNPVFAIFLGFIEMVAHAWAHSKNRKLENSGIYYQSPLHIIVREFCASCREEEATNKIHKIQERRSKLKKCGIECVRQIVT